MSSVIVQPNGSIFYPTQPYAKGRVRHLSDTSQNVVAPMSTIVVGSGKKFEYMIFPVVSHTYFIPKPSTWD
jgi:hypothetical protein